MILGSLSFSFKEDLAEITKRFRHPPEMNELTLVRVAHYNFSGAYCLHPDLPYVSSDHYYFDEARDIAVLLSGSIFNKQELYPLLNISVPVPDPSLLASLYLSEGPEFVRRLNGDFAIFILRPVKKQAYLFRDQVGVRPMYWACENRIFMFSSDCLSMPRTISDSHAIDTEYLLGYFKYVNYGRTPFKNVRHLLPGHYLEYSEKGVRITRYWEPEKIRIDRHLSYQDMLRDLKILVIDAVSIRADRRFNCGAHLSSGLDSALVSALVRRKCFNQEKFYGFSWSPESFNPGEIKYDEREIIKRYSREEGIFPVFSTLDSEGLLRIVSSPYGNPALFYEDRNAVQASELGVNLIFSGWGGDEFISTGDRGVEQDLLRGMRLRTFFSRNPVRPLRKFLVNQLHYVIYPALGILDRVTAGSFADDARYIRKQFRKSDRKAISNFYFHSSRRQLHLGMLKFGHLQRRCENWMISGYRRGVEYRYPFLDIRIIEYMLKVPSHILCKLNEFRPLLRELGKDVLPDEIRLNYSKTDPVSWAYTRLLYRETAGLLLNEVKSWKENPALNFIDFDLLNRDTDVFESSRVTGEDVALWKSIVTIKFLHEFTRTFRDS